MDEGKDDWWQYVETEWNFLEKPTTTIQENASGLNDSGWFEWVAEITYTCELHKWPHTRAVMGRDEADLIYALEALPANACWGYAEFEYEEAEYGTPRGYRVTQPWVTPSNDTPEAVLKDVSTVPVQYSARTKWPHPITATSAP